VFIGVHPCLNNLGAGLAACLAAQHISGTIDGVVLDASGAAVPNAKVTVSNVDRNQVVRALTTDMGGNYTAPIIPIGNYEVKAAAAGFKTASRTGIVLNVNDDLKINITLEVGAVTESVRCAKRPQPWSWAAWS
jgi:Carboxypeptidase regulatory-like domain